MSPAVGPVMEGAAVLTGGGMLGTPPPHRLRFAQAVLPKEDIGTGRWRRLEEPVAEGLHFSFPGGRCRRPQGLVTEGGSGSHQAARDGQAYRLLSFGRNGRRSGLPRSCQFPAAAATIVSSGSRNRASDSAVSNGSTSCTKDRAMSRAMRVPWSTLTAWWDEGSAGRAQSFS